MGLFGDSETQQNLYHIKGKVDMLNDWHTDIDEWREEVNKEIQTIKVNVEWIGNGVRYVLLGILATLVMNLLNTLGYHLIGH